MKGDPAVNCEDLGGAHAAAFGPNWQVSLRNKLKNKAAKMGGNYVRLETADAVGNNYNGTVFKCP